MADHKIQLAMKGASVHCKPKLENLKYTVGDTFTFSSKNGAIRAQWSVPGVKPPAKVQAPLGGSLTTYPLPKEPFRCMCGLTLPDGTQVGWPKDKNSGNQTGGGN